MWKASVERMKKKIILMLLCVSFLTCLCGCSFGKTKVVWTGGFLSNQIFKMDGEVCTVGEMNIIMAIIIMTIIILSKMVL